LPDAAMNSQPKVSYSEKERTLRSGLILGLVFMVPGATASIFSNSVTILTDFLVSTVETLAVCFSWYAIRQTVKGRDFNFNYGYGKLEAMASLVVMLALGGSFVGILFGAWNRFTHPITVGGIGIAVSVGLNLFAMVMNFRLWLRNLQLNDLAQSPVLEGQIKLFRNKVFSSLCVLSTLGFSFFFRKHEWARYLDPVGSLVLSGFLIHSAIRLFNISIEHLMDKTIEEPLQMEIIKVLTEHFMRYSHLHDVRSRRSGGDIYIDLHLEFDPEAPVRDAMESIRTITMDLQKRILGCHVQVILTETSVALTND
jgi:ferrous-iron efflux pump FieF